MTANQSNPTPEQRLEAMVRQLKELDAKATPAPWNNDGSDGDRFQKTGIAWEYGLVGQTFNQDPRQDFEAGPNCDLICLLRNLVPDILDLLKRLDAAEAPCVWREDDDGLWTATCGLVDWCFNDGGPVENKVKRCCGCGHPVQVKQEDDSHD